MGRLNATDPGKVQLWCGLVPGQVDDQLATRGRVIVRPSLMSRLCR